MCLETNPIVWNLLHHTKTGLASFKVGGLPIGLREASLDQEFGLAGATLELRLPPVPCLAAGLSEGWPNG